MYGKNSNWVLNEAMNLRKLHIGGTFKNALSRKLDNVVIPLFAELIAVVDHNYNLRHLKHLSTEQTTVQEFWLRMFSDAKVLQLNYADIVGREKVPVIDDNFECQLPFSWLIKDAVDSHLEQAKSTCGECNLANCIPIVLLKNIIMYLYNRFFFQTMLGISIISCVRCFLSRL